ncbi:MAG: energy transducer TonB [Candidatus Eremiobacteraeota bacterium]|nr:energy transducer TonB [Candidatus Eremiobacteraeota bacterium]
MNSLSKHCALVIAMVLAIGCPAYAIVGGDLTKDHPDPFCAARVTGIVPIHQLSLPVDEHDLGTDDEYGVIVEADEAKTISGNIEVLSRNQPYSVRFTQELLPAEYAVRDGQNVVRSGTAFKSAPVYFRLPVKSPLDAVWIGSVSVAGKPADCATLPLVHNDAANLTNLKTQEAGLTAAEIRTSAPVSAPRAIPGTAVNRADCPALVKDARMVSGYTPPYPAGVSIRSATVLVKIALDAAGNVADASVLKSGGNAAIDNNAVFAAIHSSFAPRTFLCTPIPGFYVFRAHFFIP